MVRWLKHYFGPTRFNAEVSGDGGIKEVEVKYVDSKYVLRMKFDFTVGRGNHDVQLMNFRDSETGTVYQQYELAAGDQGFSVHFKDPADVDRDYEIVLVDGSNNVYSEDTIRLEKVRY